MNRVEVEGLWSDAPPGAQVGLAADALPTAVSAALPCPRCGARASVQAPLAFRSDWDDDLRVHELWFEAVLRAVCIGCGAELRRDLQVVVYRDRASGRRWAEVLPTVTGGES